MSSAQAANLWTPFRIAPRFVERVWGFRDLRPWFDCVSQGEPIGEVWLNGDDCLVETGALAGKTLAQAFAADPAALLGTGAPSGESPLLLKVIFAESKLSVQVHPDDALAQKYGQPRGKTECWYALDAQPGARVACGLKPGVTMDQVREGIAQGTLEESLNTIEIAAGEMIYVDAGTVHAIWPGSILLETQQNCDITYRMYDYGRPRELHIEKSIEATRTETQAGKTTPRTLSDRRVLADADYFLVEQIQVSGTIRSQQLRGEEKAGLEYLFAAAGSARVRGEGFALDLPARGLIAVPAAAPEFVLEDADGLDLIRMSPRWPEK